MLNVASQPPALNARLEGFQGFQAPFDFSRGDEKIEPALGGINAYFLALPDDRYRSSGGGFRRDMPDAETARTA
jgi:hypothetical protein